MILWKVSWSLFFVPSQVGRILMIGIKMKFFFGIFILFTCCTLDAPFEPAGESSGDAELLDGLSGCDICNNS